MHSALLYDQQQVSAENVNLCSDKFSKQEK